MDTANPSVLHKMYLLVALPLTALMVHHHLVHASEPDVNGIAQRCPSPHRKHELAIDNGREKSKLALGIRHSSHHHELVSRLLLPAETTVLHKRIRKQLSSSRLLEILIGRSTGPRSSYIRFG